MSDSIELLRRVGQQRAAPREEDDETSLASFGYLRGLSAQSLNLELRRAGEGDSVSFPYSWLGPSRHHPSRGIVLLFSGSELYLVTLRGRNLNRLTEGGMSLYDRGILRARVTWVREVPRPESEALGPDACAVDRIEVRAVTPEQAAEALGMAPVLPK